MPTDLRSRLLVTAVVVLSAFASAAKAGGNFSDCVASLRARARTQGISPPVVKQALAKVHFVPRVIQLDRHQPEFTSTFANYLSRRVTDARVKRGRALFKKYRDLLRRLTKRYGVPGQYLLAFWGLETNYGSFVGNMPVLDSLTTLACDRRRGHYFTRQLIAALRIIQQDNVAPAAMKGSWAGALGNFQFMPTAFLRYAVDYDGDGHKAPLTSVADAMASAANFLRNLGWRTGTRWGREVLLPGDFPYYLAGLDKARPLADWRRLGIREANGQPLPEADLKAALLVPAGHRGPAFLVYHNFRVIMDWNRSRYYALSEGYLADRIAGGGTLHRPPPDNAPDLSRQTIRSLQSRLNRRGFDAGSADGVLGPATRTAIRAFQRSHGMVADGYPSARVLAALGMTYEGDHRRDPSDDGRP